MRKILIVTVCICIFASPVYALELAAPTVPDAFREFMPSSRDSFGMGLLEVLGDALSRFRPDLKEAFRVCLGIIASVMLVSVLQSFSGVTKKTAELAGAVGIAMSLMDSSAALVRMGLDTVAQINDYGKLLLPVMSAALAAQGGISSSAALYSGALLFNTLLSSMISRLVAPMIYLFMALSIGVAAIGQPMLKKIQGAAKWLLTWCLKTILYVYTGYIGITGVISGTTDAATLKAAKLTISGVVPVVGGILSDASEAVLVSAGAVKNAAGIYGLFAILAICIGPFLKIGAHYLLLKATAALCSVFGSESTANLVNDFSGAMGVVLGMTGAVCLMQVIGTVCFMRGVS